jgi:hypothetical protein
MWNLGKCLVKDAYMPLQGPFTVNVNGSSNLGTDAAERYFLTVEFSTGILKKMHPQIIAAEKINSRSGRLLPIF